jgi:hypothetical protein
MIPPSPDGRYPAYRPSALAARNVFDDSGNIPACGVCSGLVDINDEPAPSLFSINPRMN